MAWIAQAPSARIPGEHRYNIRNRAIELLRSWDLFLEANDSRINWTILSIKYPYQLQYVAKHQGVSHVIVVRRWRLIFARPSWERRFR